MTLVESLAATLEIASSARALITAGQRHLQVSPELFQVDDAVGLTPGEAANIKAFLSSPGARKLLTLMATVLICEPTSELDHASNKVFQTSFKDLCGEWCTQENAPWAAKGEAVYRHITKQLERLIPRATALEEADDATSSYMQFVSTPLVGPALSTFKKSILTLAGELERLECAETLARRISAASIGSKMPLFSHLAIEGHVDRTSLYVDRRVSLANSDSLIESNELFTSRGYRAVLVGNPGAGKSTLVEHLRRQDNPEAKWAEGTLVLTCRDYAANRWDESIADALYQVMHSDLQVDGSSPAELTDALILGRIKVILDGLDEVMDRLRRSDLVQRIERFCATYPLTSVLVTSREVGYDQAPLSTDIFALVKLQDFTSSQVNEYASRWFQATGNSGLTESFMQEVGGVMDIAVNPLLLSLLCSLYKVDGQIPSNRYDVYNRCADLLFVRWDQHRQIRHPSSVNYGMRLMEYIGSQFFNHQSAQSGLDEKQLVHLLATYLRDAFGSADPEGSARDFLDFCAERAWLLVVLTHEPKRGLRVFGFTHRTFYEYFSARSIARSSASPRDIAITALRQYQADTASFIPELLVQAADTNREGGGAAVFGEVVEHAAPPALLLRLMNAPLTFKVRHRAFVSMVSSWRDIGVSSADFAAMAQLNIDAREQLRDYLSDSTPELGVRELIEAWSQAVLQGGSTSVQKQWLREMFLELLEEKAQELSGQVPASPGRKLEPLKCTQQLLVALQHVDPQHVPLGNLFSVWTPDRRLVGGLVCLLRTEDSWLQSLTDSGLEGLRHHLLGLAGVDRHLRDQLRAGTNDIRPGVDGRYWTHNQLALAVILQMMADELKVDLPRLEGQLIRAGVLMERANGSVGWQEDVLAMKGLATMLEHRFLVTRR